MEDVENEISSGNKYNFWDYSKKLEYDPHDGSIDTTVTIPTYEPKMTLVVISPSDHHILFKMPTLERLEYDYVYLSLYDNKARIYSTSGSFRYTTVYLYIWY